MCGVALSKWGLMCGVALSEWVLMCGCLEQVGFDVRCCLEQVGVALLEQVGLTCVGVALSKCDTVNLPTLHPWVGREGFMRFHEKFREGFHEVFVKTDEDLQRLHAPCVVAEATWVLPKRLSPQPP